MEGLFTWADTCPHVMRTIPVASIAIRTHDGRRHRFCPRPTRCAPPRAFASCQVRRASGLTWKQQIHNVGCELQKGTFWGDGGSVGRPAWSPCVRSGAYAADQSARDCLFFADPGGALARLSLRGSPPTSSWPMRRHRWPWPIPTPGRVSRHHGNSWDRVSARGK